MWLNVSIRISLWSFCLLDYIALGRGSQPAVSLGSACKLYHRLTQALWVKLGKTKLFRMFMLALSHKSLWPRSSAYWSWLCALSQKLTKMCLAQLQYNIRFRSVGVEKNTNVPEQASAKGINYQAMQTGVLGNEQLAIIIICISDMLKGIFLFCSINIYIST